MSKVTHALYAMANPVLNVAYEILQSKDVKVYKGAGSINQIGSVVKKLGCKKPLFVTDSVIVQLNLLEDALSSLKKENLDFAVFDGVKSDPTSTVITDAVDVFLKNECDAVISFGGGSSIDSAKVISGLAKNPRVKKYMGMSKMMSFTLRNGTFPLISVPTTSGTGAEVTMGAVISDAETHQKSVVIDKNFTAKHVFLDPMLTIGLPPNITAATAFDALVHAIEAYVSKFATRKSNTSSISAIKDIFEFLPIAYEDGKNVEARNKVLIASNEAGFAIGRTHIGAVHSIGHNAGAIYGIPHGLIVGMILPHIMEIYLEKCERQFAELARAINAVSHSDSQSAAARKFIDRVWELSERVGIPKTHEKIAVDKFEEIAEKAIKESYGYPIPTYVSKEDIINILNNISG